MLIVWFTVNKQSDEVRLDIFFRPLWVKVTSRSSWPCWMTTCLKDRKWTVLPAQARSRTQRQRKLKTAIKLMRTRQLVSITNHWVNSFIVYSGTWILCIHKKNYWRFPDKSFSIIMVNKFTNKDEWWTFFDIIIF